MIFDLLRDKVNSVVANFDTIVVDAMMDSKEFIIDLNVDQLEHGISPDGDHVGVYESDEYADQKQLMGSKAPRGIVDTKDEGSFHEGFYAEPFYTGDSERSGLYIDSKDWKTPMLESQYRMFGIAPQNSPELIEEVLPKILKQITNGITG